MCPTESHASQAPPSPWRLLILALLPLLLIGPSLLPGKRFLPQLPVMFEPLASENPEASARAWEGANLVSSDALFPMLTDEFAMREQLAEGTLPLWSRELGMGMPLAAGSMVAPWNPLRWPFLWLSPDVARGWHALIALFLAGFGMLLFLELRVSTGAALFGAIAVQASGFAYANLHYLPKLDAALWLPWCLWAIEVAMRRPSRRAEFAVFASLACSGLAGFPPIFVFVLAVSFVWFCVQCFRAPLKRVAWVLGFATLGSLAASVYLVPMASVAVDSTRGMQTSEEIASQALAPAALLGFVSPSIFGEATDELPLSQHPVAWWLSRTGESAEILAGNRLEWSLFIGCSVLVLALAALGANRRKLWFPLAALVLCLGFQFGAPGARTMYALPGFDLGSPARVGALTWFLWPWLAALGLDALLRRERGVRWIAGGVSVVLGLACFGWAMFGGVDAEWIVEFERALAAKHGVSMDELRDYFSSEQATLAFEALRTAALIAGLYSAATLAIVVLSRRLAHWQSTTLLAGLVALGGFTASCSWNRPQSLAPGESVFPPSEAIEAIRSAAGDGRVLRIDESGSGVDEVLRLARPNMLHAYGLRDLTPFVALPDSLLVHTLRGISREGSFRSGWSAAPEAELVGDARLDEMNITCVLSVRPLSEPNLEPVFELEDFHVYRRRSPGRVVFATELETSWRDAGIHATAEIELLDETHDSHTWKVDGSEEGFLRVSERGPYRWRATVDGAPARLNEYTLYLEVPLAPGEHLVRLEHAPEDFHFGASLSLGALLVAVALLALAAHRSRRAADPVMLRGDAPPNPR